MHVPVVVLGGGPGGYAAAFLAADEGLEVVIVESEPKLGGTCLLRGCIPSKALLHVAKVIEEAHERSEGWGVEYPKPKIDINKVRARKEKVIETLTGAKSIPVIIFEDGSYLIEPSNAELGAKAGVPQS